MILIKILIEEKMIVKIGTILIKIETFLLQKKIIAYKRKNIREKIPS
mgnify:CR=1 FL=1